MASQDGSGYQLDPTEMLWECSVCVDCTGEDVVVEIATRTDAVPTSRLSAAHTASVNAAPGATYSPGRQRADRHAA